MTHTLFVVDLDNTVADASRRLAHAGPEPDKADKASYSTWLSNVQNKYSLAADPKVAGMCDLVWGLYKAGDMIYLTSREEKYRDVSKEWLYNNEFPPAPMYMRNNGSWDHAHDLKERVIKEFLQENPFIEEVVVLDDDPSGELTKVCKKNGWTMLKVGG